MQQQLMLENINLYLLGFSFFFTLFTFLKDSLEKFQQFEIFYKKPNWETS